MKTIAFCILTIFCISYTSVDAVTIIRRNGSVINTSNQNTSSNCPKIYPSSPHKPYMPSKTDLPQATTHVQSNGRGGYTWIDSGNPNSENILDRLPQTHAIDPDGRGGYYIR